jgi:methylthioribose-1-phosphate isomerase
MKIRGAPVIGIAGAYAVALGALKTESSDIKKFRNALRGIIEAVAATRPTARNLFFALERMRKIIERAETMGKTRNTLVAEAQKIHVEEAAATEKIGLSGADLVKDGWTVLTHCNTGPLATSGRGTALGIIIMAQQQGKKIEVFVDETRPLLQGARLTAWELQKAGVPFTLITDSMAGHFISGGRINCIIAGADRIAANGDTANKIGTYTLAVLAHENGIPFYIAAPTTTIDRNIKTGGEIPIEERGAEEVTHVGGVSIAPEGVRAANPAFDVTPHRRITAIITEKGIVRPPYSASIKSLF